MNYPTIKFKLKPSNIAYIFGVVGGSITFIKIMEELSELNFGLSFEKTIIMFFIFVGLLWFGIFLEGFE